MYTTLDYSVDANGICWIKMIRPKQGNALVVPTGFDEMGEAFRQASDDPDAKVVIWCAEGKHFCAGGDIADMKRRLESTPHLRLVQAEISAVETEETESGRPRVAAVVTPLGERWNVRAAVVATGTYLGGRIHIGEASAESGPDGQLPATRLTASLAALGLSLRRFKTGTPQRIDRRTVDFSLLERQDGELSPLPFFRAGAVWRKHENRKV